MSTDEASAARRLCLVADRGGLCDALTRATRHTFGRLRADPGAQLAPGAAGIGTIPLRDVRPWRAGSQAPINAVQNPAVLSARHAPRLVR
jgi:hypothetical protein